ncbi:hypothetical protein OG233_13990 [Streptomyces sp. NBC_01218]|uniref:hypothetical protein n=1 Tax=Streptomyces sp. NBC_01218 TaxID=2903780 RepID=UPI002E106275|nr:hypothetical protein OG233_13990 [Streptomyces sp. NBC_01218]
MSTAKTARRAFTCAAKLTTALAAVRDLYAVLPTMTVTPDAVLVAIPWHVGRDNMRAALAGDIAELLGTELAMHASEDEDGMYLDLVASGELDGVPVRVILTCPPSPVEPVGT